MSFYIFWLPLLRFGYHFGNQFFCFSKQTLGNKEAKNVWIRRISHSRIDRISFVQGWRFAHGSNKHPMWCVLINLSLGSPRAHPGGVSLLYLHHRTCYNLQLSHALVPKFWLKSRCSDLSERVSITYPMNSYFLGLSLLLLSSLY